MSKKITVRNPDHPHNQRAAAVKRSRVATRSLSNKDLDAFIRNSIEDDALCEAVLGMSRAHKIKYIAQCVYDEWTRRYNEAQKAAAAEAEQTEETPPCVKKDA